MKRSIEIIKFIILLGIMAFLFSFTKKRNDARKLTKLDVEFVDENSPFITYNTVNKLLIQNQAKVTSIGKETLVLKMVRDAQVYVSVDGTLGAKIEQRKPIGRVSASPDYYLDADGKKMPLSDVYSARVPLITGISKNNFALPTEYTYNKIIELYNLKDCKSLKELRDEAWWV